jgi:cysteine desulfurase family protein
MKTVYLDNAATTFIKPRCVIKDLNFCLKKYCGNPGRSSHGLSIKAAEAIYSVREKIADLLHVTTPENVVFTYNATYALNIAIKAFVSEKCHIITSSFEHNSVIRPLESLKNELKIEYDKIDYDDDIIASLKRITRRDTKGIICSIASNVTGDGLPLRILSDYARDNSLFLIIDASQAIGHYDINLSETPCDALCAPGHKALFGIQGSGFVWFKDNTRRKTLIEGGSGSESANIYMPMLLPEGYEAGTLSTPAIVSLGSGIDYISKVGIDEIDRRLNYLTNDLYDKLSSLNNLTVYKSGNGLVSFNINGMSSSLLASMLDRDGICVRGGLHCAPSIHTLLETIEQGAVRASFSFLNTKTDSEKLYKALRDILFII